MVTYRAVLRDINAKTSFCFCLQTSIQAGACSAQCAHTSVDVADMKGSVKQAKQDFYGKHKWLLGKQGQAGHWPRL